MWFGKGFEAEQRKGNDPQVDPPFRKSWEVSGTMGSPSVAGKMGCFIPITGTLPTQVQHPIKAFGYTLSHLPRAFHPWFSRLAQ